MVFVVLVNGAENVNAFSFVFKFVIVAYVVEAVAVLNRMLKLYFVMQSYRKLINLN